MKVLRTEKQPQIRERTRQISMVRHPSHERTSRDEASAIFATYNCAESQNLAGILTCLALLYGTTRTRRSLPPALAALLSLLCLENPLESAVWGREYAVRPLHLQAISFFIRYTVYQNELSRRR